MTRAEWGRRRGRSGTQLCRKSTRFAIYDRDGFCCVHCRKAFGPENLSLDHVVPRSLGGTNLHTNLVTACRRCNSRRGAGTPSRRVAKRMAKRVTIPIDREMGRALANLYTAARA